MKIVDGKADKTAYIKLLELIDKMSAEELSELLPKLKQLAKQDKKARKKSFLGDCMNDNLNEAEKLAQKCINESMANIELMIDSNNGKEPIKQFVGEQFASETAKYIKRRKKELTALTISHGKAIDNLLPTIQNGKPCEYRIDADVFKSYQSKNMTVTVLQNYEVGMSAFKLLIFGLHALTHNNSHKNSIEVNCEVAFTLEDYCEFQGFKTETKSEKDNIRRKMIKAIDSLYWLSVDWQERYDGKVKSFKKMRIVQEIELSDSIFKIVFTDSYAEYLQHLPLTKIPKALCRLDDRQINAFVIGFRLAELAKYNSISIGKLLALTDLPTADKLKANHMSWQNRVKTPLENALNALIGIGLVHTWHYESNETINNFESYKRAIVRFELASCYCR